MGMRRRKSRNERMRVREVREKMLRKIFHRKRILLLMQVPIVWTVNGLLYCIKSIRGA